MSLPNSSLVESHIYKRFTLIKKIGSGAYGHVWKVQQKHSLKIFALKKIFDAFQHATDAQRTYRQIQILKQTQHGNIVKLHQTLKANNGKDVYLVFQYMESDLHNVINSDILKDIHVKFIIYQVARALKYLHSGFVIHRDLKPSNILINTDCVIKLCDFGLVRSFFAKEDTEPVLTQGVATRWYRAPEVLLGSRSYSTPADVWSFGCIIYEILTKKPLFPGTSTIDQVQKLCQSTGYPSEEDIKSLNSQSAPFMLSQIKLPNTHKPQVSYFQKFNPQIRNLLTRMIVFNPTKRITIDEIIKHESVQMFYKVEDDVLCEKQFLLKVDDNKKLSVQEYRQMIYTQASNSVARIRRDLSEATGKSHSLKVIRKTVGFNQPLNMSVKELKTISSMKKQVQKNNSYHAFKAPTHTKEHSSVSFITCTKQDVKGDEVKQESKNLPQTKDTKDSKYRFGSPPTSLKTQTKWSPKFFVKKSPFNQPQSSNKTTNQSSLVTPTFAKESTQQEIIQKNSNVPAPQTSISTNLQVKKANRTFNSPSNVAFSKYLSPSTGMNIVKKQIPCRSPNFIFNSSFKSPNKRDDSASQQIKYKIGEERKLSNFGKASTKIHENNTELSTKEQEKEKNNEQQCSDKFLNPQTQKTFKSYQQKVSTSFAVWNSPKATNLKKQFNPNAIKNKPSYFNSQKYIKPASLNVTNPEAKDVKKNDVQNDG